MDNQVEEVKQKTDIAAVIGERVELTKAGRNMKGKCPFHNERTPSFMVNPSLQIFKCFGCGESGDVFTFLQKYEGMEFYECLQHLAERAGVELRSGSSGLDREKEEILKALSLASKFYSYILGEHKDGEAAREYLSSRGIKQETIDAFNLGATAKGFDRLAKYMIKKGFSGKILERAGLCIAGPRGYYDRFRERVIFPITDPRGRTIAFGGRILPGVDESKQAKYINSPESPVYSKSRSLYGLSVTKGEIGRSRSAILVEGEFDLLSSWQSGVRGVVAIKGSALTEEQVNLISRYADRVVMALDRDFAGQGAAVRGIELLKQAGLDVVVAKIPSRYKDPDEFAMADPAGWEASVRGATDVWSFMIDVLFAKHEGLSGSQKAKIGVEAARILSRIPDEIERIHHAKNVAERLGVPYEVIAKRVGPGYYASPSGSLGSHHSGKVEEKDRRMLLEERLLALAFSSEPRLLTDRGLVEHIQTPLPKKIVQFYLDYVADGGEWDMSVFGRELPSELFEGFASMVTLEEDEVDAKLELVQVERELREFVLKARIVDLTRAIGEYERMGDEEKLLAAQRELSKLSSELSSLTEEMP